MLYSRIPNSTLIWSGKIHEGLQKLRLTYSKNPTFHDFHIKF